MKHTPQAFRTLAKHRKLRKPARSGMVRVEWPRALERLEATNLQGLEKTVGPRKLYPGPFCFISCLSP